MKYFVLPNHRSNVTKSSSKSTYQLYSWICMESKHKLIESNFLILLYTENCIKSTTDLHYKGHNNTTINRYVNIGKTPQNTVQKNN